MNMLIPIARASFGIIGSIIAIDLIDQYRAIRKAKNRPSVKEIYRAKRLARKAAMK